MRATNSPLACGGMVQHRFRWGRSSVFNTRLMVEWSRSGSPSVSATCFSSSRRLHRSYPAGGAEQASAITRASTSPVTIRAPAASVASSG